MKSRNEVFNTVAGTVSRFMKLISKEKTSILKSATNSKSDMNRVTDQFGNEYLCPTSSLKDPNFVNESEKSGCFEYDHISRTYVS